MYRGFFVGKVSEGYIKIEVILNLFQNLPHGLLVVAVILESRSPGSVVIKKEENNRYWTETFQYDLYF